MTTTLPGAYFITICTFQRLPLFGDIADGEVRLNDCGKTAHVCWNAIPGHFPNARLDAFVVMPNHVHGILWIDAVGATHASPLPRLRYRSGPPRGSLGAIIGSYKSAVSRKMDAIHQTTPSSLWQRNYYERIIRDDNELNAVRQYIADNPSKWHEDELNPAVTHS